MSDVINRVVSRIKTVVGKAIIEAVSDDNQLQLVKISGLADDVQSDVERIQDYGITSNPPVGSEAVVLYINGGKDHGVVIKTDSSEFRVQGLESGEVCIYSKFGQKILLDKDGFIVCNTGGDYAALSSKVDDFISMIDTVFRTSWVPVPQDGGAALKTAYLSGLATPPLTVASSILKTD